MSQASSFLKRRAEERKKILEEKNGASSSGGSVQTTTQNSLDMPLGGGQDGAPATRASDFLRKRAEERAAIIDQEYGADAYGGTEWREPDKVSGFNSWLSDVASLSEQLSKDYTTRQGQYQSQADFDKYHSENAAAIARLVNRGNTYRNYFNDNAALFDEETRKNVQNVLTQYGDYLTTARGNLDNEQAFWGLFEDEAAYTGYLRGQEYAALPQSADFAENSQYKSTYRGGEKFNALAGIYTDTGFDDIMYDYINRDETARSRQNLSDIQSNASFLGLDNSERGEMTDEEIGIFNYLYATQGSEAAYEYIDYITSDLNFRQRQSEQQRWAEYASEDPFGSSVFSIIESPLKGLSYLGQFADYAADGSIDQNEGYNKFSYINTAIRDEVSGIVEENWGGVGTFAYQIGMSMGDFLFNTAISGGNQALTLAIMGTGAAADTTISAKDRGLSDGQAFALGTVAGAAEVAMEKLSLDKLFDLKTLGESSLRYVLQNTLTEGGEEVGTELINTLADFVIAQDQSEWNTSIEAYMAQGMSQEEATKQTLKDKALEFGLAGLGGMISGGIISGGGVAINTIGNQLQAPDAPAVEQVEQVPPVAADVPVEAPADNQAAAPAISPDSMTNSDIAAELANAGATEAEAESLAPVIAAVLTGEEISGNQAGAIAKNEAAVSVLESTTGEQINTDAPLGEVKSTIRGLASRHNAAAEATATEDTPAQTQPVQAEKTAPPQPMNGQQSVKEFAATLGKAGEKVFNDMYNEEQNAVSYVDAMMKAYNAGKNGSSLDGISSNIVTPPQLQAAYIAGQADADSALLAENSQKSYTRNDPGVSDLGGQLAIRDVATVNGIKYTLRQAGDGQYFLNIDRDTAVLGGYIDDARSHVYDAGPFATRGEAVQEALDVARNNKLTEQEDTGNGERTSSEIPDGDRVLEPARDGQDAGGLLDGVAAQNVREDESGGDAGADPDGRGLPAGRPARGSDTAGVPAGRGLGSGEAGNLRTSAGVSESGKGAILSYKSGDSYRINALLLTGSELDEYYTNLRDELDAALKELPVYAGRVYRNLGFDDFGGKEEKDAFVAQHMVGVPVSYGAYTSTSKAVDGHPIDGEHIVNLVIESVTGKELAGYGNNSEQEVLFERDAVFIPTEITVGEDGHPLIYMKEDVDNGAVQQETDGRHSGRPEAKQQGVRPETPRSEVRDVQEVQTGDGRAADVQQVSERDTVGDPAREGELRSVPAEVTDQEVSEKADLATTEEPRGNNFVIGEKGQKLPTTPKARFKANADAIKALRSIMADGRMATAEEQETLARYTGWGGLTAAFDEKSAEWSREYKQLKKLLDDGEYKTAKASILDAYYTEPAIIQGMYNGLAKLGFTGGRLLEPSAGVGRFLGAMPVDMLGGVKSWTAVELDKITGNIAKYLYPNADVRVQGFETAKIPDNYMDVVIGNVPFGNFGVADKAYPAAVTKSIHNYFIAKSIDKARPGGIVAVITSSGTLDAIGADARSYFMKKADLIGAIRLPNTAFEGTGTGVVSDILVLKKREAGTAYKGENFLDVERKPWTGPNQYGSYEINEYFAEHPEMVLGTPAYGKGQYGRTVVTYNPLDSRLSLQKQIEKAFGRIKVQMEYPAQRTQEEIRAEIKADAGRAKQGAIVSKGGKLYKNDGGQLVEASDIKPGDVQRMSDAVAIRDTARSLLDLQMDDGGAPAITKARKQLNALYDAFVKQHGYLNSPKNKKLIQNDADYPFILALENYDKETGAASKAAIFSKNTIKAVKTVTHADTVEEALTVSMNETGTVDVARIAQLTGQQAEDVRQEMLERRLAFKNRNGDLEAAELYLSGNVRAKLRDAEALAEGDSDYQRNVEALREVIPADIPAEEIKVRLGATWVPDSIYSAFVGEMLGGVGMSWKNGQRVPGVEVTYNRPVGKFFVEINDSWVRNRPENTSTWGTPDYPLVGGRSNILEAALNNKTVAVWRSVGDNKRVLDRQATAAAQEKLEQVLAEFQRWIWADEARRTELGGLYNDVFNNTVTPKYDGSHLTVNGSNPDMPMRPHQLNAVQRIINSGGNTLLAHRVGAGKTYEMAAAAMKLRQLGIVKKPMFIAPKHLVAQWGNEFLSYFPAAKILVLEAKDFTPANRKLFANRIATGDYDAVIMSYEQFGMVPMSKENQEAFYQDQIDALEMAILESRRANGKKDPSIRDMERSKKSFEAKLKKLGDSRKDVDNIDFEQLGIDALFVDEAHNFKNLFYTTKMQGIADLGDKEGSQRAFDLYMKVRYLQKLNGGRGIVFATATPVMNSVVELYTMQRYLQGDLLDAKGLTNFDAWANQFGDVVTIRKMKTGGNGYELKQSLSKYKNLAEMQQMFRGFADVIADAADLPYLKIPKMKTGKRIVVECDPSPFQESFMEELGKRAEALRGAGKGGSEDHIFKVFNDGKKISYTQRMIDSSLPYEDGGKVMKVVENVARIWKESTGVKGTQLIFCDQGTPGGAEAARGAALYADIKNLLVGSGIPESEIAFIHDANTDEAKSQLFRDVNAGKVRVLMGSTSTMGTGMNAQQRIVAMHELNAPDRPGDLEQNEGRGLRQGNINDEVAVYAYVTKKTFDSRQWDNLKRKATFIHQVMAGEYNGREADGDGDLALSAAEISAIASDNPLIMEQFEVSEKIANLENLERAHTKEVAQAKQRIAKARAEIAEDEVYLERFKSDLASRQDTAGEKFRIVLNGKTYTERKAAGEAFVALAKKLLKVGDPTETNIEVGSFAGFKLLLTSKGDMLLRGKAQYRGNVNMQSAAGTIQALEAIPRRLDGMIAATETRLAENRAAIAKLEQTASAPFARSEELIAARVREAEIMAELNPPSEQAVAAAEDEGDVESMVEYDVAQDAAPHPERWQAERVGSTDKAPMRPAEIMEKIRHDFGLNITTGHIRGAGVRGQYNQRDKGIRTKIANDLPTTAHELGHALNQRYGLLGEGLTDDMKAELENALGDLKDGYSKKLWHSEGLAEYIRKFLQNRETAAIDYPKFTEHFLNSLSAKDTALIEQLADEINAYYSLDADTATSSIRLRGEKAPDARTWSEKIRDSAGVFYQAWFDTNEGIKKFSTSIDNQRAYTLASNAAYSDAMAGQIIVGDLTDANAQYVAPGLKAALHGLNLKNEHEYRLFGEYLAVKHGPERLAEGMRVFADDRKNSTGFMQRRQAELEQQHPEFVEASARLYEFQRKFLRTWGVNTGLVSPEMADQWAQRWQYYVPFNRLVEGKGNLAGAKRGFANQNSTIKRAKGSGLDIVHPVDNIINNIVRMVNAGVRNNVMRTITDQAEVFGADAAFIEKIPTPMVPKKFDATTIKDKLTNWLEESELDPRSKNMATEIVGNLDDVLVQFSRGKPKDNRVTVLKNGEPEFWKVNDPYLLKSISTLSTKKMEGILGAIGAVHRFMTGNITGNNLIWSIFSNLPRDLQTLFTYSPTKNPLKVFGGIGSAYVNKVKGDDASKLYKEFLAMGGGKSGYYSADRELTSRAIAQISKAGKKYNVSANPADWIGFASDLIESGPRYATYKFLRENGVDPQEAFYAAMDITVNFRRGGELARQVNAVVPFFNAGMQGLDKLRRWITAEGTPQADRAKVVRLRVSTYVAVSAVMAALFYGLNNRDDEAEEEYEQLSNYTKNSFWNIPLGDGYFFAIPKPRELGVLSSFFETLMERTVGGNDHAFDEFYGYWAENCLPGIVSDIAQVPQDGFVETGISVVGNAGIFGALVYMGANRDFLGRPIVSSGMQNLEPRDQYNDRTSKIAYWIGKATNASPMMVDYFFQQVLGGFWKVQKALLPVGEKERDLTLGVLNTYKKDNAYSQDLTNWLYDQADASSRAYNSDKQNMEKNIAAKMDSKMTSFYGNYNGIAKNEPESVANRGTRQTVLAMILEYRKHLESGHLTREQSMVYSVVEATDRTELLPAVMNTYVKDGNGEKHELSAVQYVEYQTDYNRRYWEYIEENLDTSARASVQAAIIAAARETAREDATNATLRRIMAPLTAHAVKYDGVSEGDVIRFEADIDLANDDGSLKQDEVIDILKLMIANEGLSAEEAYILFHSRYDSDKNNPWRNYKP